MGELIRQVLVDLMRDDLIFFDCDREQLFEPGKNIFSNFTSFIVFCRSGDLKINALVHSTQKTSGEQSREKSFVLFFLNKFRPLICADYLRS